MKLYGVIQLCISPLVQWIICGMTAPSNWFNVFHLKLQHNQNGLIFCTLQLQAFCGIVQKSRNIYRPDFFHESDGNGVFSQHHLRNRCIIIKYIFLNHISYLHETNFLRTMYPTNMHIESKFVVDFHGFRVNNFRIPQKQENRNNWFFLLRKRWCLSEYFTFCQRWW